MVLDALFSVAFLEYSALFNPDAVRLQSLVAPKEAIDMKMVWEAPDDDWEAYIHTHMEAIRAKYFPKNAQAKVRRAPSVPCINPNEVSRPPTASSLQHAKK